MRILHCRRGHLDLLDQLALVGIDCVEAKHHVMLVHVGRGIAQRAEWIHRIQSLFATPLEATIHTLGFVHDDDGPSRLDQVYGLFTTGLLAVLVEVVDVLLVDGAHCHHHDLDVRVGGEVAHLPELVGVVEEVVEGHPGVEPLEVILGDLQGLVDAFLDRHRRHHDDELAEAIAFVQLEDAAQIDVGLTGAGFHLHGEVAGRQRAGWGQTTPQLNVR